MIRVGATGHRDLTGYDMDELKKEIYEILKKLTYGHERHILLSSIAAGADQLCAEIALELGYELICPLPFAEYRNDFNGEEQINYDILLGQASESFVVSGNADKNEAYLAAGKYIAENCDVLIAVWDGNPQPSTCGTQAVVEFAKSLKKDIILLTRCQG